MLNRHQKGDLILIHNRKLDGGERLIEKGKALKLELLIPVPEEGGLLQEKAMVKIPGGFGVRALQMKQLGFKGSQTPGDGNPCTRKHGR
ncbi:hypothetical protein D3C81_2154340 [compost metagenome]